MPNYSKGETLLVSYPFSDLTGLKVRPAVVVSTAHSSQDLFIVPLTSQIKRLLAGEFVLSDEQAAGLHIVTAVKRGLFTVEKHLVRKSLGQLSPADLAQLEKSLRGWLGLP